MTVNRRCRGFGVEHQLKHAIPEMTDAERSNIKSVTSIIFAKIASPKLNVIVTRQSLSVDMPISVTSSAVMDTSATPALYFLSAVSCS